MGVLGIVPYLRKKYPYVLKSVPSRFGGLRGKVIVFDGTLITQRFHFAPTPLEYRHILGWYRLIKDLHHNNVRAICVFDGRERNAAKSREITRRSLQRNMANVRSEIEVERLSRLGKLAPLVTTFESLSKEKKAAVATSLLKVSRDSPADRLPGNGVNLDPEVDRTTVKPHLLKGSTDTSSVPPQLVTREDSVDTTLTETTSDLSSLTLATEKDLEPSQTQGVVDKAEEPPAHSPTQMSSMLVALYSGFLASSRQTGVHLSSRTVLPRPEDQDDETEITQELSQAQRRLVVEEESIWKRLSETTSTKDEEDVSFLARELEEKSTRILRSYQRRNSPPTDEVYGQCRIILQALGVPCIEAESGVEGEALAAAIVRNGCADYVASEDTDVLVYGAPLLRNVTSGTMPLILIEGCEVRDALDMDSYQFLDFALLLGTDYTDRIRNVGPVHAAKFIHSYGSIEKILEGEPKCTPKTPASDYLEQIRVARGVFQLRPMVPPPELLETRQSDELHIVEVLQKFGLQRFAERGSDFSSLLGADYFSDHP